MRKPVDYNDSSKEADKKEQAAIHITLPKALHRNFKLSAIANGDTMNAVLLRMIESYVLNHHDKENGDEFKK